MSNVEKEQNITNALADTQHWMQAALMFPRMVEQQQVSEQLLASGNLAAADCLAIYQRSYYSRLLSCMTEQFPALCHCLGEPLFNQFAAEYLREMPSNSYTLYELGRRFAGYLADTRPDKALPVEQQALWIDFMVELAGFERLAFTLFDAPGDEGNLVDDRTLTDDKLGLQRGLSIYQARFPVARYYCLVRDHKDPDLPPLQDAYVALVRVNYSTRLVLLNALQYRFLQHLMAVDNIAEALALTANGLLVAEREKKIDIPSLWSVAGGWRDQWLAKGFFVLSLGQSKT